MNRWTLCLGRRLAALSVLFLLCVVGLLAGATPAIASEGLAAAVWPMLGSSVGHDSLSGFQGPNTNQLAWKFSTNAGIDGGPAIDVDGTVFFGSDNGGFFAVDQTGHLRWSVKTLTPVVGVPALARGGKVYVATTSGVLYAFDVVTGSSLWTYQTHS